MPKKVFDVVPADTFMGQWIAKTNYDLIGLTIRKPKKIEVQYEPNN